MSNNIKVAIRVRPLISREKNDKLKEQWEVSDNAIYPIDITTGKRNGDVYFFDHIFDNTHRNVDIYNTVVHPVVDKAMNGFNGTIFAYGQTSSGKTYTMMGSAEEHGLIYTAVQNIFLAIEQSVNRKFLLRVSYMEIYNEKLYDLLDIKNTVKISEDYSGSVIVNVKEEVTDCADKVYEIMKKGDKARRIGETNMNEKSSRSHTIFRIIIESSDINDTGVVNVAHLNLVDLAGSERATYTKATGQRLKEGAHINKSLSTLSLVMKQLSESQDYINFRDSKLTRILQPSLGGNALTAIICAVTPVALEETHSTLAFASRAKTVKNKPLLNEVVTDEALINRYASEINQLKKDLEVANDNSTLQAQRIAMLEKCILFSKKTNVSNKSRRKTWSAPHDTLPIIFETDVLRLSDYSNPVPDNLQSIKPKDDISVDMVKSTPISDEENIPWSTPIGVDNFVTLRDTEPNENLRTPFKKTDDVMNWLMNSTDTPASVLRERADYYENEFNSLKELTTRERLFLTNEHNSELESIKLELAHTKNELEREKDLRKEIESKLLTEKKTIEKLEFKNEELTNQNMQFQKKVDIKNDNEYLVEIYKDKYKKREKELLESLQEAREMLKINSNNTDDEKTKVIFNDVSLTSVMKEVIDKCKNLLITLKFDLEANQPISVVEHLFSQLKILNEEMINNYRDCPEELQEFFSVFSYIIDVITIVFSDDTLIQSLENDKQLLQSREKTYELLVSKQDEEIKHLSDNILQYMNELNFYKNEVTKYKDLYRFESSIHTDLDFSMNDTKNENALHNSILDKSELFFNSEKHVQTDENMPALIQAKDKEIEDLTNKIKEYVEQLTSLENELKLLKTFSYNDQSAQTDINDEDIEAKLQDDINYLQQINELEEEMKILKDQFETEKKMHENEKRQILAEKQEMIDAKNKEMEKLSNEMIACTEQLEQQKIELQKLTTDIGKYQILKKTDEDVSSIIELKDKEILDLSDKLIEYSELHTSLEREIEDQKQSLGKHHDILEAKNKTIQEMTLRIDTLYNQLSFLDNKSSAVIEQNIIEDKDKQIAELIEDLSVYVKQLSAEEEKYENMVEEKNKEIDEINSRLLEVSTQMSIARDELQMYKFNDDTNKQEIEQLKTMLSQVENELLLNKANVEKADLEKQEQLALYKYNEETSKQEIEQLKTMLSQVENELLLNKAIVEKADLEKQEQLALYKCNEETSKQEIEQLKTMLSQVENELLMNKANAEKAELETQEQLKLYKCNEETSKQEIEQLKTMLSQVENELLLNKTNAEKADLEKQEQLALYKCNEERNKQELEQLRSEMSNIQKELEDYKNKIEEEKEILNSKNIENLQLLEKITTLEEELNKLITLTNCDHYILKIEIKDEEIKTMKNKLEATEKELNNLKARSEIESDIIDAKNEEIQELSARILDNINNITSLMLTTQSQEDTIKVKVQENEELSSDLMDHKLQINSLQRKVINSESKIKNQLEEINYQDQEIRRLLGIVRKNVEEVQLTEEILYNMEPVLYKQHDDIKSKSEEVHELSSKLDESIDIIISLEEKIKKIESNVQMQDDEIKSKNKEIEEMTSKIIDYLTEITLLQENKQLQDSEIRSKIKEIEELNSLKEKLTKYESELVSKDDLINRKNKDIDNISKNIQDYESEILSLNNIIKAYETDTKEKDLLISKDKEIEEYICKLSSAEEELHKLKLEIKEIMKINEFNVEVKKKDFENYQSTLEQYKNSIIEKDEEINNLTHKIQTLEAEINNLQFTVREKNKDLENFQSTIATYNSTIIEKDEEINNLTQKIQTLEDNICIQSGNIKQLTTDISEKENIIILKENDVQNLKEIIKENNEKLSELYVKYSIPNVDKPEQTKSFNDIIKYLLSEESKKWTNILKTEKHKSEEYITKINILDQQLNTFNDQIKKMRSEYEIMQNSYVQCNKENETLKEQVRSLQSQMTHQECTLQQCKDFINQLEVERSKLLENSNMLRNTSLIEIQKLTEKLQEKNKYIENIQKELVALQNKGQNNNLTEEMAKLKQKNEDYKKIVSEVTEKANYKFTTYHNSMVKLNQSNELLKSQLILEKKSNQALQNQISVLQGEINKRTSGICSGYDIVKLQSDIRHLEEDNKKLKELNETYQEQLYTKSQELSLIKKSIESIKRENIDLVNKTKDLYKKLEQKEDQLRVTTSNLQLLEKEKENYSDNARILEESLEDIKFELYELKNKEREKFKKIKRQSLHDSSRSISSDEQISINDENQKLNLQLSESSDAFKTHDKDRSNRLPLSEKKSDEQCDNCTKLRKKNDQLTSLCKIRKHKIDEMERKLQIHTSP